MYEIDLQSANGYFYNCYHFGKYCQHHTEALDLQKHRICCLWFAMGDTSRNDEWCESIKEKYVVGEDCWNCSYSYRCVYKSIYLLIKPISVGRRESDEKSIYV